MKRKHPKMQDYGSACHQARDMSPEARKLLVFLSALSLAPRCCTCVPQRKGPQALLLALYRELGCPAYNETSSQAYGYDSKIANQGLTPVLWLQQWALSAPSTFDCQLGLMPSALHSLRNPRPVSALGQRLRTVMHDREGAHATPSEQHP